MRQADRAGLNAIGLQVGPGVALADPQRRIEGMGLEVEQQSDPRPGAPSLLAVEVGGHQFHLLPEIATVGPGFSGRGIEPVRVGHVAILSFATMHHLAFQLDGRDHQFRAADHLTRACVPSLWRSARHTAGRHIATCHRGADDAPIELYSDMDVFVPERG